MNFFVKNTRAINFVPRSILFGLIISLILQCLWHASYVSFQVEEHDLPPAPESGLIKIISLNDSVTAAKIIMLWLQAFDNQPGISIPLKSLNYDRVIEWLDLILKLDSNIQYPLLAAIRFYAEVPDEHRQRKMVRYVIKKFLEKPNKRWPFMAHAVYIAKHRIKDLKLALECAKLIREYAVGDNVPYWTKQLEIFVLEDMGELESAKILIGGLLDSGELEDSSQKRFLLQRLKEIEERQKVEIESSN